MKLLFDENLSHRLVFLLRDLYPGSAHLGALGLKRAPDTEIWQFAQSQGFVIVSKDVDFYHRSVLRGHPPKVIWLNVRNASTRHVEQLLRDHAHEVELFASDTTASFLILT